MANRNLDELMGLLGKFTRFSATEVRNDWRSIVEAIRRGEEVLVTTYNQPEMVLVPPDKFVSLVEQANANDPLVLLREEFDEQLATLRAPGAADRLREAFAASPEEIAEAANSVDPQE